MSIVHTFWKWLRFRLRVYLPFLRPDGFQLQGSLRFDLYSYIDVDNSASFVCTGSLRLRRSRIHLRGQSLWSISTAELDRGIIYLEDSRCELGPQARISCTSVGLHDHTTFHAGEHLWIGGDGRSPSGVYARRSRIQLGDNFTHNARTVCHQSVLEAGDSVFLNQGTQIRCDHSIQFGSYIFVSYDCLIFDTNTHSLDAADRRHEIRSGYPNTTRQDAEMQPRIKKAPIRIGDDVWIGTRVLIFKGTTLGHRVIVGAAAVLSGIQVEEGQRVAGNPARII